MTVKRAAVILILAVISLSIASSARAQVFPQLTISPDPLDFGSVRAGTTSSAMTVTVTANQGSLPAYIFRTRLGDSVDFAITNDGCANAVLNAGESCTVDITFSPPQSGHYYTTLAVISISQDVLDYSLVEGLGIAPRVTLSTTNVNFGDQTVNKTSTEHDVVMVNSGNTTLNISDIQASDNFGVADDCGATLASEASCNLEITFTPNAIAPFTGTVTITDDASDSPQVISLSGTGIAEGQADASLSRHEIDFANQLVGTTSAAQEVTLKSTGTIALNITSIIASANFGVTDDCVSPLAVDATCTLDITFMPDAAGSFSGTVTITDDANDSPQTISLTGVGIENSGPQASLSATLIDFGQQAINTTSEAQTVTLTNTGDENLLITDTELGGDNPDVFSGVDDCFEKTLSPGESCDGSAQFTPTTKEVYNATVTITDNSSDSPQTIALTGIGLRSSGGNCSIAGGSMALSIAPTALLLLSLLAIRRRRG
jgi:hypothetical protein